MIWDQLMEMFRTQYVLLVKRERLAQEYMLLMQTRKLVKKITQIFTEIALFFPEYAASERFQMSHYLSMLKMRIYEILSRLRGTVLSSRCSPSLRGERLRLRPRERGGRPRFIHT